MSSSDPDSSVSTPRPKRNLWQRRIADPIVAQLTQGLTPEKIAVTVAIGSAVAMFPILGMTTLLCLLLGIALKLNQPIIQAVNYACTPLHLTFIVFAFRSGERWFGRNHSPVEFKSMMRLLHQHPLDFVSTYSPSAMHAVMVWLMFVPIWTAATYYLMLPIMRGIDRVRIESAAKAAAEKARDHPVP